MNLNEKLYVTFKNEYIKADRLLYGYMCMGIALMNLFPKELQTLAGYCRTEDLGLVAGCEANAHNEVWGSTDTNGRGEILLENLIEEGLVMLQTGAEPTFVTITRREVLDITVCNGLMRT